MKTSILIILISLLITNCEEEAKEDEKKQIYSVVTGKFKENVADKVYLVKYNRYDFNTIPEIIDTCDMDFYGRFYMNFPLDKFERLNLKFDDKFFAWYIYSWPGDTVFVDATTHRLAFYGRGKGSLGTQRSKEFYRSFMPDSQYYAIIFNPDIETFTNYINDRKRKQIDYYKKYVDRDSVPAMVKNDVLAYIDYRYAKDRVVFLLEDYTMDNEVKMFFDTWQSDQQKLKKLAPDITQGFGGLFQALMKEGALSVREKELIALGIGLAVRCSPCIKLHVQKTRRLLEGQ